MTDENKKSSDFSRSEACGDWVMTGLLSGGYGAEHEANEGARFGFEVEAFLKALGEQDRMAIGDVCPHDHHRGLARIDLLELAGLDAVAQDQFDDRADALLV